MPSFFGNGVPEYPAIDSTSRPWYPGLEDSAGALLRSPKGLQNPFHRAPLSSREAASATGIKPRPSLRGRGVLGRAEFSKKSYSCTPTRTPSGGIVGTYRRLAVVRSP